MAANADRRIARSLAGASARRTPERGGTLVYASFALLGLLLVGYLLFLILRTSWAFSPLLDGWLVVAFEAVASGLCVASLLRRRIHRRVAVLLGIACFAWTIGDLAVTVESLGGATPPMPSVADAFYLGFYPLALMAMYLYVREEMRRGHVPNWLDGAIAACGVAAACAAFAVHPLTHLASVFSLAQATNLTYVVGDLVLVGIVAGTSVVASGRSRATLALIVVGLSVNGLGDTFNFIGSSTGVAGSVVNGIAWPTAIFLIAMSMWIREDDSDRFALHAVSELVLPSVVTCSSLAILVASSWVHVGALAVALATLTLVFVGVRLAFRPALRIAREQLRATEERYRFLFESNPQPMVVYDRNTLEIVDVSNAMVEQYGYTKDELGAMTIRELLRPEDVERLVAYLASNPEGSRPYLANRPEGYPGYHRLKDGTIIDVEVTSANLDLNGRRCRIAHFADVTARNKATAEVAIARDQAVEASNMKSAFLANVSHEVRTPMNGVIGMTELLLDTELDEEQREYAEQVSRSGEQMLAILNDILDLSKIEGGHLELDIADFDLHETVTETCSVAGAQARAKGLRLTAEIGEEVPRHGRGDGRRIRQILLNMVSNAVKFTAAGTVAVRVGAKPGNQGSSLVRIEVSDTGIGIDPDKLQRMFEPFTQADVSTTRDYGGTGLGLAIAREIVEMMGGKIGADSEPGAGSTFWFEVELAVPAAAEAQAGAGEQTAALSAWARPPLVLIAEDSQINQIVASRTLERCGCHAQIVADGHEAIEAFKAQEFDLVLMDCQMPKLDGYETTAALRRLETAGRHTPIIAMTAHALEGDRERCLSAGMDDYISKPMASKALRAVLERWIPFDAADRVSVSDALRASVVGRGAQGLVGSHSSASTRT
jgi:PAS domain S-box-containing protein